MPRLEAACGDCGDYGPRLVGVLVGGIFGREVVRGLNNRPPRSLPSNPLVLAFTTRRGGRGGGTLTTWNITSRRQQGH